MQLKNSLKSFGHRRLFTCFYIVLHLYEIFQSVKKCKFKILLLMHSISSSYAIFIAEISDCFGFPDVVGLNVSHLWIFEWLWIPSIIRPSVVVQMWQPVPKSTKRQKGKFQQVLWPFTLNLASTIIPTSSITYKLLQ